VQTFLAILFFAIFASPAFSAADDTSRLSGYLAKISPSELNAQAERYGPPSAEFPAVPLMRGADIVGWAFLTSDFVSTTG